MKEKINRMKNGTWLAFGAHADDVEIGMAATIKLETDQGRRVVICDLTEAELSSNGDVDTRKEEAANAAMHLGVKERYNLGLPDRGLYMNETYIAQIMTLIRTVQPDTVFLPYWEDRHPDHGNCARLVEEAVFSAAVRNAKDAEGLPSHRVTRILYYMINGFHKPQVMVDVTKTYGAKLDALNAYISQFVKGDSGHDTPLVNGYIEAVEARERLFGKEAGVQFAEGFMSRSPVLLPQL